MYLERYERIFKGMKKAVIIAVSLLAILSLSSCAVPFIPEVPPSSYSLEAAINVIAGKYYLLDSGPVEGFGDVNLGDGWYATFADVDGILLVFKYNSVDEAKEKWDVITKRYGNPLKLKYFKVSMGDYGIFTIRLDKSDLYVWYRDDWLIVVNGDNVEKFVRDVNNIYKTIKR